MVSVPIIADEEVERVNLGRASAPADWYSRCLYIGEEGAQHWLDVLNEATYALHGRDSYGLRANRLTAIERASAGTLVSLGPGDGEHDVDLVKALKLRSPELAYIPVEICSGLLERAIRNLKDHVDIPVGILGDFERGPTFLREALDKFARRPILFSLVGGTIGNLDVGEPRFFAGMRELIQTGDSFLLDVPLAGPAWSVHDDPRLDKLKYTPCFKRFLAGGLAHRVPELKARADPNWFDERIECVFSEDGAITGTKVITVRDRPTGVVVLRFLRYDWESIGHWFEAEGFDVAAAMCSLSSPADKFGMGVILLTRGGHC